MGHREFHSLTDFEKLVKMQHYGAPTRLLDFTGNPLIALYFACSDKEEADNDGAVMVTNLPMFFVDNVPLDLVLKEICSPKSTSASMSDNSISSNNSMMGIIPKLDNQRLKNQDGYFACLSRA